MAKKPSPLFLAAIDANAASEKVLDKLRNVRRPLTRAEQYAINLVIDRADDLTDRLESKCLHDVLKGATR